MVLEMRYQLGKDLKISLDLDQQEIAIMPVANLIKG